MTTYSAPWSRALIIISIAVCVVLVGVAVLTAWQVTGFPAPWVWWPLLVPVGAALFTIRGYAIAGRVLLVQRLLWQTRISLRDFESARHQPDAMRGSLRLVGNGGMFAFSGLFRNKTLGRYRAFVTDPARAVVLRLGSRTVVVSPGDPESFVREVEAQCR